MKRHLPVATTCLLFLFIAAVTGCNKGADTTTNSPAPQAVPLWKIYKDLLPGTWSWGHRYSYYPPSGPGYDTTFDDTSFPIVLLNDSTLLVKDHTLRYTDSIHYSQYAGKIGDTANFVYYYDWDFAGSYRDCSFTLNRNNDSVMLVINNARPHTTSRTTFTTKIRR